jgi:hypothetical protein
MEGIAESGAGVMRVQNNLGGVECNARRRLIWSKHRWCKTK